MEEQGIHREDGAHQEVSGGSARVGRAGRVGRSISTQVRRPWPQTFIRPGPQVRASALDPYKAFLVTTLEQYPRLRATRLHEMLRARGYPGSANQVRRYVRTIRPAARAEAFLRLETLPGEQAQVDWGNFGAYRIGHARRVLSCFVLVLSWSRAVYARFALDQTLESFLRGHVEAFVALGGVPRTILFDYVPRYIIIVGLREVVWVNSGTFGCDDMVRSPAACR